MVPRAETDDPRLVQQAEIMEEDFIIQVQAIPDKDPAMRRLQQADWPMLQHYDPMIWHVLDWVLLPTARRVLLGDYLEGKSPEWGETTVCASPERLPCQTTNAVPGDNTSKHS